MVHRTQASRLPTPPALHGPAIRETLEIKVCFARLAHLRWAHARGPAHTLPTAQTGAPVPSAPTSPRTPLLRTRTRTRPQLPRRTLRSRPLAGGPACLAIWTGRRARRRATGSRGAEHSMSTAETAATFWPEPPRSFLPLISPRPTPRAHATARSKRPLAVVARRCSKKSPGPLSARSRGLARQRRRVMPPAARSATRTRHACFGCGRCPRGAHSAT